MQKNHMLKELLLPLLIMTYPCSSAGQTYSAVNYSQNQYAVNTVAPTVASLMKAIDNPVGLYYGNPNISHEIYTLHDGHIELPIILSYTSSGIKVNEEASWVGLGWNINVGGMIAQSAVGDIDRENEYNNVYSVDRNYFPPGETPAYSIIPYITYDKSKHDTFFEYGLADKIQPDIYYFSYPGGSGKFCYNYENGGLHLLDDTKPLVIERSHDSGFPFYGYLNWCITTEDGTRNYYEGNLISLTDKERVVSRTANLTMTVLPNGQKIHYCYSSKKNHTTRNYGENQNMIVKAASGVCLCNPMGNQQYRPLESYASVTDVEENYLDSIVTDNYTVIFKKSGRQDYENAQQIDEIIVHCRHSQWNVPDRRFKFEYTYADSKDKSSLGYYNQNPKASDGYYDISRLSKRLLLKSVYETDNSGNKNDKLDFSYYCPNDLPLKTSFSIDYWGYNNGKKNYCILPSFHDLYYGQNNDTQKVQNSIGDRSCDTVLVQCGMLDTIRYQTGGATVYNYESHRYATNHPIPPFYSKCASNGDISNLDSAKLSDRNTSTDVKYKYIHVADGQAIHFSASLSRGLSSWSELTGAGYQIVSFTGEHPVLVKSGSFTPVSTDQAVAKVNEYVIVSGTGNYGVYINLPDDLGDQSTINSKHVCLTGEAHTELYYYFVKDRKFNYGGGVRVKQVDNYDDASCRQLSMSYRYTYPDDAGILKVPLTFDRTFHGLRYVQNYYNKVQPDLATTELGYDGTEVFLSSNNLHSAPYSSSCANVGYSKVIVSKCGDSGLSGYSVSEFANNLESSCDCAIQITQQGNGKPTYEKEYDSKGNLVKSVAYGYSFERTYQNRGICVTNFFNRSPEFYQTTGSDLWGYCLASNNGSLLDYGEYDGRYLTMLYPINSERVLLKNKTTSIDGITLEENYTYDDKCQLVSTSETRSDGKVYCANYKYPYDFTLGTVEKQMTSMNMLSYPVEITERVNDILVDGQFTKYASNTSLHTVWPTKVYRLSSKGQTVPNVTTSNADGTVNAPYYPYADTEYSQYDNYGNPTVIRKNGLETVYLWGYGYQYPIAEIHGSSYGQVGQLLGTSPESLSSQVSPSASILTKLRNYAEGLVTTYTWKPLNGMESLTKPNGDVTLFQYDSFGRLIKGIDQNGKTIQQNIYHYQPK